MENLVADLRGAGRGNCVRHPASPAEPPLCLFWGDRRPPIGNSECDVLVLLAGICVDCFKVNMIYVCHFVAVVLEEEVLEILQARKGKLKLACVRPEARTYPARDLRFRENLNLHRCFAAFLIHSQSVDQSCLQQAKTQAPVANRLTAK